MERNELSTERAIDYEFAGVEVATIERWLRWVRVEFPVAASGQLSGWLWLENAGIVVVSLVAGTGLGLLIGWVVLPFVTVTQEAAAPFPPPLVQTPWLSIGLLVVVSTLALGFTVVVLAAVMRRIGIGSVLRMGED